MWKIQDVVATGAVQDIIQKAHSLNTFLNSDYFCFCQIHADTLLMKNNLSCTLFILFSTCSVLPEVFPIWIPLVMACACYTHLFIDFNSHRGMSVNFWGTFSVVFQLSSQTESKN